MYACSQGECCKLYKTLAKKDEVADPVGIDQILLTSLTALQLQTKPDALVESLTTAGALGTDHKVQFRWDALLVVVNSLLKKLIKARDDGSKAPSKEDNLKLWHRLEANSYGWWTTDRRCVAVGLFPSASFFNHSCNANLGREQLRATGSKPQFGYTALVDIEAGEEMTVFYTRPDTMAETRRESLKKTYGFVCECWRCHFEIDTCAGLSPEERDEMQAKEDAFLVATLCKDEACLGVRLPGLDPAHGFRCAACGVASPGDGAGAAGAAGE